MYELRIMFFNHYNSMELFAVSTNLLVMKFRETFATFYMRFHHFCETFLEMLLKKPKNSKSPLINYLSSIQLENCN
jgi:hypothetical protein